MARDPITAEVISNHLLSISEEMTAALIRSAYSANIKERKDCSSALLTVEGEVVAQAAHSPVHLGGMQGAARSLLRVFDVDDVRPGDVFISNDPYLGAAVHLNDVSLAAPIFSQDKVIAFAACTAHHADIGGRVPGGEACDSTSVYEEGVRIPPTRVFNEGVIDNGLLDVVRANSRNPSEVDGDFRAQFAAVELGRRRVEALLKSHGATDVSVTIEDLLQHCDRRFLNKLRDLPYGEYSSTDWADDDWATGRPFPVNVTIRIGEDGIRVDLRDNVDQVASSRNVSEGMLLATIYSGLRSVIDPYLPPNSGYARSVEVLTRPGSIFHPNPPAAVGLGPRTCQILLGAMFGAFAEISPTTVCAGSATQAGIQLFGYDSRRDRHYLNYERVGGGFGARLASDGLDGVQFGVTNTSNLPIEASESEYPVMVDRYEIITDSGGAGATRGGLGVRRDIRLLGDNAILTAQGERILNPPPGLSGGMPGATGRMRLNPGGDREAELPTAFANLELVRGDVICLETAGGGGFGEPRDRDPELVSEDITTGRVTRAAAERDYGFQDTT